MDYQGIECIAVMSPDNNPIFLQKYYPGIQDFDMYTLIFCSLDYFESKVVHKPITKNDCFLGNIQTSDNFQIWGYKSGLNYKIIIVTTRTLAQMDQLMLQTFEKIQTFLFDAFMNPFYSPFSLLDSTNFKDKVQEIVSQFKMPPEPK